MPFTALILNPIHPGAAMAARELGALGEVRTYPTTPDSPGPEQVVQALSEGAGSVVVAGGNDTQRLVAGALADTDAAAPDPAGHPAFANASPHFLQYI